MATPNPSKSIFPGDYQDAAGEAMVIGEKYRCCKKDQAHIIVKCVRLVPPEETATLQSQFISDYGRSFRCVLFVRDGELDFAKMRQFAIEWVKEFLTTVGRTILGADTVKAGSFSGGQSVGWMVILTGFNKKFAVFFDWDGNFKHVILEAEYVIENIQ